MEKNSPILILLGAILVLAGVAVFLLLQRPEQMIIQLSGPGRAASLQGLSIGCGDQTTTTPSAQHQAATVSVDGSSDCKVDWEIKCSNEQNLRSGNTDIGGQAGAVCDTGNHIESVKVTCLESEEKEKQDCIWDINYQ